MIKNHTTSISMSTLPQIPDKDAGADVPLLRAFNSHMRSDRKEAVFLDAGLADRQVPLDDIPGDMAVAVFGGNTMD